MILESSKIIIPDRYIKLSKHWYGLPDKPCRCLHTFLLRHSNGDL